MCDDTLSDLAGFNDDPAEASSYLQVILVLQSDMFASHEPAGLHHSCLRCKIDVTFV